VRRELAGAVDRASRVTGAGGATSRIHDAGAREHLEPSGTIAMPTPAATKLTTVADSIASCATIGSKPASRHAAMTVSAQLGRGEAGKRMRRLARERAQRKARLARERVRVGEHERHAVLAYGVHDEVGVSAGTRRRPTSISPAAERLDLRGGGHLAQHELDVREAARGAHAAAAARRRR
jgi:hypothetical protein